MHRFLALAAALVMLSVGGCASAPSAAEEQAARELHFHEAMEAGLRLLDSDLVPTDGADMAAYREPVLEAAYQGCEMLEGDPRLRDNPLTYEVMALGGDMTEAESIVIMQAIEEHLCPID